MSAVFTIKDAGPNHLHRVLIENISISDHLCMHDMMISLEKT